MDTYELEQIVKGFANHRRIQILVLLKQQPELSVEDVAEILCVDYNSVAVHLKRLTSSGLVHRKYVGRRVEHSVSKRGNDVITFLRKL